MATWIDAIIANTENGHFLDDLAGRIIVPDLDALLAEPQHSEVSNKGSIYDWRNMLIAFAGTYSRDRAYRAHHSLGLRYSVQV